MKRIFAFIIIFAFISSVSSNIIMADNSTSIFYVDCKIGKDDGSFDGKSIVLPYKTIQKAANEMKAGDVCYIREGIYRETILPTQSGTEQLPIKFEAYNNESVTVSGVDNVSASNWSLHSDNIYKTQLTSKTTQVFVNSIPAGYSRYPNTSNDLLIPKLINIYSKTATAVIGNFGMKANNFWTGATVWTNTNPGYVYQTAKVASSSGNTLTIDTNSASDFWSTYTGTGYGYITGLLSLLDSANEWFVDESNMLYMYTSDPSQKQVEIKKREYSFNLTDRAYINIKKINMIACRINMTNSIQCVIDNCSMKYLNERLDIKNCWPANTGMVLSANSDGAGIFISGSGNLIKNCMIDNGSGDGITMIGTNNKVYNNIIRNFNYGGTDCAGITVAGTSNIIERNTVYNTGRSSIVFRHMENGKIKYNDIYNAGYLTKDFGIIYTYDTDGLNTEIAYNFVHDVVNGTFGINSSGCMGIYLDNNTSNFTVHHNVVWNVINGIQLNLNSTNNYVYNNTLFLIKVNNFGYWNPGSATAQNVKIYNNLLKKSNILIASGMEYLYNVVDENLTLIDSSQRYFNPLEGSVAIDTGTVILGITDGFVGSAPDIGAYEYGTTLWTAGHIGNSEPLNSKTAFSDIMAKEYDAVGPASDVDIKTNNSLALLGRDESLCYQNVKFNGSPVKFSLNIATTLTTTMQVIIKPTGSGNNPNSGTVISTINVGSTGGFSYYKNQYSTISSTVLPGIYDVYFKVITGTASSSSTIGDIMSFKFYKNDIFMVSSNFKNGLAVISSLQGVQSIIGEAQVQNISGISHNFNISMALYDEKDRLIRITNQNKTASYTTSNSPNYNPSLTTATITMDISDINMTIEYHVKLFVWENTTEMIPLGESITIFY